MEESAKRWRSLNQNSAPIRLVKASASAASATATTGVPSTCWLGEDAAGVEAQIAAAQGRSAKPVIPPADACGNTSPVLAAATRAALASLRLRSDLPGAAA